VCSKALHPIHDEIHTTFLKHRGSWYKSTQTNKYKDMADAPWEAANRHAAAQLKRKFE
jgi:hypothetical protein